MVIMCDDQQEPPPPPEPVQHVSVKPPAISNTNVKRWFTILESPFSLQLISTDVTKCCYVISSLPVEVLDKVPDDVITSNVYDTLKNNIIDQLVKPQQFNDLIQNNALTTRPTLYLQHLRSIGSNFNLTGDFLKIQFLNNMPSAIRPNLVAHQGSLDEIARTADTLLAYNYNSPGYNFISNHNQASSSFAPKSDQSVSYHVSHQSRSNHKPNYFNNSSQFIDYSSDNVPKNVCAFNNKQRPKICSYHIDYGHTAKRYCMLNSPSVQTLPDSRPTSRNSSPSPAKHNQSN